MIYVGIDVAKQKHSASVMSSEGEVLILPFSFSNDYTGFQLILSKLSVFEKESVIVRLESTAHYGESLTYFLIKLISTITSIPPD